MTALFAVTAIAALFSCFVGGVLIGVLYAEYLRYRLIHILSPEVFFSIVRCLAKEEPR